MVSLVDIRLKAYAILEHASVALPLGMVTDVFRSPKSARTAAKRTLFFGRFFAEIDV